MEILYKSKSAIVVYKPPLIPSQPDLSGDDDAMTLTSRILRDNGEDNHLWLIHRLDRVVGGLMVFARNARTAAELSRLVSGGEIGKEYFAVVEGTPTGGVMEDFIYKDKSKSKAFITDRERKGVKYCKLEYLPIASSESDGKIYTLVKIKLHTGRYHQIRAQFSSRKLPLVGDKKYGSRDAKSHIPALFAYKLDISLGKEQIAVSALPPTDCYPWNLFPKEGYDL